MKNSWRSGDNTATYQYFLLCQNLWHDSWYSSFREEDIWKHFDLRTPVPHDFANQEQKNGRERAHLGLFVWHYHTPCVCLFNTRVRVRSFVQTPPRSFPLQHNANNCWTTCVIRSRLEETDCWFTPIHSNCLLSASTTDFPAPCALRLLDHEAIVRLPLLLRQCHAIAQLGKQLYGILLCKSLPSSYLDNVMPSRWGWH